MEKLNTSALIGRGPLNSVVTKDKGKTTITAIKYSAPDRAMLFTFTTTPNHFEYGLIGQVSALKSKTYMWTHKRGEKLV